MGKTKITINDPFKRWIIRKRNRITRKNKNWLCIIAGQTGSSKSYTGARVCELIDPTFMPSIINDGIKSRVAMGRNKELLRILDSGKLKRGNMILFDEAGVAIGNRDWFKQMNKVVMYVLQTFRHMNIGVIFTVPDIGMVDKQSRSLFHSFLETIHIDYKKNESHVKPFELQNNPYDSHVYRKYPRFKGKRVVRFRIKKPNKEFITRYEPLKIELSNFLRERALIEDERLDRKEKIKRTDKEIMQDIKNKNFPLDAYRLQFEFAIGKDRAYRIIKNYEEFSPFLK